MQAADFRNLDHLTERRKLDRSADGRIFFERQMRTASFVVFEIILQNPAQPGLMENNDVNPGIRDGWSPAVVPQRDFATAIAAQPGLPEYPSISPSHSTSHRTRGRRRAASNAGVVPGESFQKLTGCPFCCGVSGHREMNRTSAVMVKNHKDE